MNNYRMKPLEHTRAAKRRIIDGVEQKITTPSRKQKPILRPLWVLAALLLCAVMAVPILQQTARTADVTIEKLEFPDVSYSSLNQAQFVEETRELLIEQNNMLYIYDIDEQLMKQAAAVEDGLIFDAQLSKDWFVYEHITDEENVYVVVNRQTNETTTITGDFFGLTQLSDDYLIYLQFTEGTPGEFVRHDLKTNEKKVIAALPEANASNIFVQQNKIILYEEQFIDKHYETTITVYDVESLQQLGQFTTDFRSITSIHLRGQELFMLYIDQDRQKIGSYHLQKEQFTHYPLDEKIDDFATDGEYFAVAIGNAGKSRVKLYKRNGTELLPTNALEHIAERTVRPRLFGDTFIMNGEVEGNPMYLIEGND